MRAVHEKVVDRGLDGRLDGGWFASECMCVHNTGTVLSTSALKGRRYRHEQARWTPKHDSVLVRISLFSSTQEPFSCMNKCCVDKVDLCK
jgi:hypothetical protein